MKLPTYQFIAQMSAAFAVVVSLGFVAYELKLARDIALAQIYQDKTELIMNINTASVDPSALLSATIKLDTSPDTLDFEDVYLLYGELGAKFSYYENNHFLYQHGMVTEEQLATIWSEIESLFRRSELNRDYWIMSSEDGAWRESFTQEVDRILDELGPVQPWTNSENKQWIEKQRCLAAAKCQAEREH